MRGFSRGRSHIAWAEPEKAPATRDFLSAKWIADAGRPEAEQLRCGWLEQVHAGNRAALMALWQAAVDARGTFHVEFPIRCYDGAYVWFDTQTMPRLEGEGRVVRIGSNGDIEDRDCRLHCEATAP